MGKFNEKPIVTYRSNIGEDSHDNNHTYAEHIACNREYQRKRKLIKKQERDYLKIC